MATFHKLKKEVGERVLSKFKNKCTTCGSDKDLCVHHIIKMPIGSPNYNDEANLTVLCRSCHMRHHRINNDIESVGRMKGKKVYCSFLGCKKPQHGKMLCKKHYAAKYRTQQGW